MPRWNRQGLCHLLGALAGLVTLNQACALPAMAQPAQASPTAATVDLAEAERLDAQSVKLREAGQYVQAQPLAEQAVALREKALGPEHPAVAASLNNLANLYWDQGNYSAAEPLYRRSLAIREKALGPEHPEVARSLNSLGVLSFDRGDFAAAQSFWKRALTIREKALGPEHLEVGRSLSNLATLYSEQGDYAGAEPLYRRALAIREKASGPEHPEVANSLNNLALLYFERGDYAQAEPLFRRSLAIREKALGPEHPEVAQSLNNLANLYVDRGDYIGAEPLYSRSLAIREKALGPEHPRVAASLNNLANLDLRRGDYTQAEHRYRRTLAIYEKALGPHHPQVADSLNSLGELYSSRGDYAQAEPLIRRALAIWEKAFGPEHPDVARSLHNLAGLSLSQGNLAEAEALYRRTLAIREKALGPEHPRLAESLQDFALLHLAQGQPARSLPLLKRALDIQEHNLTLNLAPGSEAQKRDYLKLLADSTDLAVWLHLERASTQPAAARLALTTVLRRKGRILDELTTNLAVARARPEDAGKALLASLTQDRTRLATLIFSRSSSDDPARFKAEWQRLDSRVRQLEGRLAETSAEFRAATRPVSLAAVQRQLPSDTTLVELVRYRPYNLKAASKAARFGVPRYAAYLLSARGEPTAIDLGEAAPVDQLAKQLVGLLRNRLSSEIERRSVSTRLSAILWRPLERRLPGRTRQILVSADGALHLLPFAPLVDGEGRYLLTRYSLTYLASGRDLLRLGDPYAPPRGQAVILGGPDFERSQPLLLAAGSERSGDSSRPVDLGRLALAALPGAQREASTLARLVPGARLLIGARATENALKALRGPALLHLATHGFFLKDATAGGLSLAGDGLETPLLRSGLALAGFNSRTSGSEDGVLTALEAAGLDLGGTQLVVLSACDTGLGEVANGEGVYGLRRAFTIAGARSQVFSLWKVDDRETVRLMSGYYRRLRLGQGRGEALRQVQLQLLGDRQYSHPYWWAGFVETGEWRPLPKR